MCLKIKKKEVISINIEEGKFYFIKNEFFDKFNNKEMCLNKKDGNKRPCYYCFKDIVNEEIYWLIPISSKVDKYKRIYEQKQKKYGKVDNIVFGYVEGEKRAFLIQNMFPTLKEYIIEKYIKQQREVVINKELKKELNKKANKILKLVEKGYKNLVFSDIIKIRRLLIEEIKSN